VDVDFSRDLDVIAPEEWRGEIDQLLFPGGYFKEFVFFHKASRTLRLTDTIVNLELDKISEPWKRTREPILLRRLHTEIASRSLNPSRSFSSKSASI
jgi:hypothetical protein